MSILMKVKCNGINHHTNEIDLDKYTKPTIVVRGSLSQNRKIPERLVVPCQYCTEEKIIITREMIEQFQKITNS